MQANRTNYATEGKQKKFNLNSLQQQLADSKKAREPYYMHLGNDRKRGTKSDSKNPLHISALKTTSNEQWQPS